MKTVKSQVKKAVSLQWKQAVLFAIALGLSATTLISCGTEVQSNDAYDTVSATTSETSSSTSATSETSGTTTATVSEFGVGPIKASLNISGAADASMAGKGQEIFDTKCSACHNTTADRKVGPGLQGITERRKPEWIMNMILNPEGMVKEDPTAKELLATYMAPMANQNLTEEEARAVVEYFRKNDGK